MDFSTNTYDVVDTNKGELMHETLSNKLAALSGQTESQAVTGSGDNLFSLDDLSRISRDMLLDKNLEVSKVRPFFWGLVEAYVERFQVFPFDAIKALFSYLELYEYPEEQLRELINRLEKHYQKQHGRPVLGPEQQPAADASRVQTLDDEINELRETLKYAAIAGERIDGKE